MKDTVIETHDLTMFYGVHRGVIDVKLSVERGEVFGFLGPNGAGKTTTQRLLLDVIHPARGRASIFSYFDTSSTVFREGVRARDVLTLMGLAAGFFALAVLCFRRRNVTVGAWPWQRGTIGEGKGVG